MLSELKSNTIEEVVTKPMSKLTLIPLGEEESIFLFKLLMSKDEVTIPESEKPHLLQIVEHRVKVQFNFTISTKVALLISVLSKTPGSAMLYLWYIQYKMRELGYKVGSELTMTIFCDSIIPMGKFSDEDLHKIWDAQKFKGTPDNAVDYSKAGESLKLVD